jgi:hypothetical protein
MPITYKIIFAIFILFLLIGCSKISPCEQSELLRVTSPDNRVDAVLLRINCGATTDYSYKIYIVPKASSTKKTNPIFVADKLDGELVKWSSTKNLLINYRQARIFNFTNFWHVRDLDNFNYIVSIREIEVE